MKILIKKLGAVTALLLLGFSLVLTAAEPSVSPPPKVVPAACPQQLAATSKRFPRLRRGLSITWGAVQTVHAFLEGQPRLWNHLANEPQKKKWVWRLYQDWLHPVVRFLSPIWLPRANTPTFPVFKRLWNNQNYEPTPGEWEMLDRHKARGVFEEKRAFMQRHPYWSKFRYVFGGTLEFARIATIVLALNFSNHILDGGSPTVHEYVNAPQYQLKKNQVRLLNETVPFPHTAIQIGDRVYSYGITHMSRSLMNEYLRHREIRRMVLAERARQGLPPPPEDPVAPGSSAQIKAWGAKTGEKALDALGLSSLPQSVQAVTLNLSEEEVNRLQRYLELQVGKQYANNTMVNDCTTMVVRALEENTRIRVSGLIDASPAQTAFYFAFQKTMGADWVGPMYQITVEEPSHPHLARNLYINILESKLFIDLVVFNQANRAYIELMYDREALQHHDPVTLQVLADFEVQYSQDVETDKQLVLWEEVTIPSLEKRALSGVDVEEGVAAVAASINDYFNDKLALADDLLAQPTLERLDILKYQVRKKILETKRIEFLGRLTRLQTPARG